MDPERHTVEVRPGLHVSLLRSQPERGAREATFVYAPGAGSNLHDPFGAHLATSLPARGIELWRMQFPYMEAKRARPDALALLEDTWSAVLDLVRREGPATIVIGGRSMGGRIASMVVAKGAEIQGLALFAYPLIPPGRNATPRSEHLPRIAVPTLFCSGTRDTFGTIEQLEAAARLVPHSTMHVLEGADHGFSVLKSSGRTREDVWEDATNALLAFMEGLTPTG
jgi:predicted alpha/beta-hydrolase family hydrolase